MDPTTKKTNWKKDEETGAEKMADRVEELQEEHLHHQMMDAVLQGPDPSIDPYGFLSMIDEIASVGSEISSSQTEPLPGVRPR